MSKFIQTSKARFQVAKTSLRNQEALIHNLEDQIGQMANLISGRQKGSLLSNIKLNPTKHVKAVALRGGKELRGDKFDSLVRESTTSNPNLMS